MHVLRENLKNVDLLDTIYSFVHSTNGFFTGCLLYFLLI